MTEELIDYTIEGKLTLPQLNDLNYRHDPTDIGLRVNEPMSVGCVIASKVYMGAMIRAPFNAKLMQAYYYYNDGISIQSSDVNIDNVNIMDIHPYAYGNHNHKDLIQLFNYDNKAHKLSNEPMRNVRIGRLAVVIGGDDKFIMHCTETCGYENFRLFENGCIVREDFGECNNRYLISTTNAVNWVIGSPEYPIDPALICDRIIRIDGRKAGSKPSKNIVIHAVKGLRLELDDSAAAALTLHEYERV